MSLVYHTYQTKEMKKDNWKKWKQLSFLIFTELTAATNTYQPVTAVSDLVATLIEFCLYGMNYPHMKLIWTPRLVLVLLNIRAVAAALQS